MPHNHSPQSLTVLLSLLLLSSSALAKGSTPTNAERTQKREAKREKSALKQAQTILGKPLSASQIKSVRTANAVREAALLPIERRYKVQVAGALGLPVAQYEARERAARRQNRANR